MRFNNFLQSAECQSPWFQGHLDDKDLVNGGELRPDQ